MQESSEPFLGTDAAVRCDENRSPRIIFTSRVANGKSGIGCAFGVGARLTESQPMPKLLIKHPEKGDLSFTLSGTRISVGRRAENGIQINHGTVSGIHAELFPVNGHYVLRDLESTNHSFLNGQRVISEVDLTEACKITFGTVECDFIPDHAKVTGPITGTDLDTLRKNIGFLRAQNDELLVKLAAQKQQIEILGSAKLIMRSKGSEEPSEHSEKLRAVTGERDDLHRQNDTLRGEIAMLRSLLQTYSDNRVADRGLKETVPIKVAPIPFQPTAVNVTPSGTVRMAAPIAKVVETSPNGDVFRYFAEIVGKMRPLTSSFTQEQESRSEMLLLAKHLVEKSNVLGTHPTGRMAKALEGLLRDVSQSGKEIPPSILRTISHAVDAFARILEPENLARCENLPLPSVLAVEDDVDFLPAMIAALEFARLPATGCADAKEALTILGECRFDLIILDLGLPDIDGLEVCKAIRAIPNHAKTPILILTGSDCIESRAQSSLCGSSDFLAKPCNLFELTLRAFTWSFKHQLGLS